MRFGFFQIELIDRVDDIYRNTSWDDEFKGYGVQIHQVRTYYTVQEKLLVPDKINGLQSVMFMDLVKTQFVNLKALSLLALTGLLSVSHEW